MICSYSRYDSPRRGKIIRECEIQEGEMYMLIHAGNVIHKFTGGWTWKLWLGRKWQRCGSNWARYMKTKAMVEVL